MFGWLYHRCPNCGTRSRKKVVRSELKSLSKVDGSRSKWDMGSRMLVEEPHTTWAYSYEVEHACRSCGNRWVEKVTTKSRW